ncbi:MAG: preprotein translocase subunit YajC [Burkholderiales bacterium]|nr:preprotein translocase subunit YajC [Burkholderiales bacterium]
MLISPAFAQAADGAQQESSLLVSLAPMILIFVVFWLLLIRPQQRKVKEHRAMVLALQKGEEVATAGGIIGRIVNLDESTLTLEIAEGTEVLVQRAAVTQLLPKGTMPKGITKDF